MRVFLDKSSYFPPNLPKRKQNERFTPLRYCQGHYRVVPVLHMKYYRYFLDNNVNDITYQTAWICRLNHLVSMAVRYGQGHYRVTGIAYEVLPIFPRQ